MLEGYPLLFIIVLLPRWEYCAHGVSYQLLYLANLSLNLTKTCCGL